MCWKPQFTWIEKTHFLPALNTCRDKPMSNKLFHCYVSQASLQEARMQPPPLKSCLLATPMLTKELACVIVCFALLFLFWPGFDHYGLHNFSISSVVYTHFHVAIACIPSFMLFAVAAVFTTQHLTSHQYYPLCSCNQLLCYHWELPSCPLTVLQDL